MKRKTLLIILVFLIIPFHLFPKELRYSGTGRTEDEAFYEAQVEACRVLFLHEPAYVIGIKGVETTSGVTSELFRQASMSLSGMLYISDTTYSKVKYGYECEIIIRDDPSTINRILDMLKSRAYDIDSYWNTSSRNRDSDWFYKVYHARLDYEGLKNELLYLGYSGRIQTPNHDNSSEYYRTEWESLCNKNNTSISNEVSLMTEQKTISEIEANATMAWMESLYEMNAEQARKEQERKQYEKELSQTVLLTAAGVETSVDSGKPDSSDIEGMLGQMVAYGLQFGVLADTVDAIINRESSLLDKQFSEEVDALKNQEYRFVEKDRNGVPTESAVINREKRIDNLKALQNQQLEHTKALIVTGMKSAIEKQFGLYANAVSRVNSIRKINSGENLSIRYKGHDLDKGYWLLSACLLYKGQTIYEFDFRLPFSALSEKLTTSYKNTDYYEYISLLNRYTSYIEEFDDYLTAELDVRVYFDIWACTFSIKANSVTVRGDGIDYSCKTIIDDGKPSYFSSIDLVLTDYDFLSIADVNSPSEKNKKKIDASNSWKNIWAKDNFIQDVYFWLSLAPSDSMGIGGGYSIVKQKGFLGFIGLFEAGFWGNNNEAEEYKVNDFCFKASGELALALEIKKNPLFLGVTIGLSTREDILSAFGFSARATYYFEVFSLFMDYDFVNKTFSAGFGLGKNRNYINELKNDMSQGK